MTATPQPPTEPVAAEVATPASGGKLKFVIAGGATVVGLVLGLLVVGPMISGKPKPAKAAKASHEAGAEGEAKSRLVKVDNVVVNPSGSDGMRFVMASVAFEVGDAVAEDRLRGSEVQVRDAINGVFERLTMAELTRAGARDSLRIALAAAVAPMLAGAPVKVFLPQFVIQ